MDMKEILEFSVKVGASDLFLVAGRPVSYKVHGEIKVLDDTRIMPDDSKRLICEIYELAGQRSMDGLLNKGDDDFSFAIPGLSRFRANTYRQRGSLAAVIRMIFFRLPDPVELGIPKTVLELGDYTKGMVLVTGPAGSGKSTTLACIIDKINKEREKHIITLEDPLEFLHRHEKSIVSQREVGADTDSYLLALRASLRQSPDVILLGEMRDYETIQVAMTAAETGHLIFSTLHTTSAANTVDRIIDVFPANQQKQIGVQLASVLKAVVCQQLVPGVDGKLLPVYEMMVVNPAIRNMIREGKVHQIDGMIYSSYGDNMISMDTSLFQLYKEGRITRETALNYAANPDMLSKRI